MINLARKLGLGTRAGMMPHCLWTNSSATIARVDNCRPVTCPATVTPSRCGCGGHRPPPSDEVDRQAADWWTWLIIACHAQLRLARPLTGDLRRPGNGPLPGRRRSPVSEEHTSEL